MAKKLLLIEDDEFIRTLYKKQLELDSIPVDTASNGQEGLDAIKKTQYDLVLLDILLPDMNGLDILEKIKQEGVNKNTPVVLLTNLGQDSVIKKGFYLGAKSYLIKSAYTPSQIVQEIKLILNQPS